MAKCFCFSVIAVFLLQDRAFGLEPIPPSNIILEKSARGFQLMLENAPSPEGGSHVQYKISDKNKLVLKRFPVSDTQFDSHAQNGEIHAEKISEETCRSNILALENELKKLKFKRVILRPNECGKENRNFAF